MACSTGRTDLRTCSVLSETESSKMPKFPFFRLNPVPWVMNFSSSSCTTVQCCGKPSEANSIVVNAGLNNSSGRGEERTGPETRGRIVQAAIFGSIFAFVGLKKKFSDGPVVLCSIANVSEG